MENQPSQFQRPSFPTQPPGSPGPPKTSFPTSPEQIPIVSEITENANFSSSEKPGGFFQGLGKITLFLFVVACIATIGIVQYPDLKDYALHTIHEFFGKTITPSPANGVPITIPIPPPLHISAPAFPIQNITIIEIKKIEDMLPQLTLFLQNKPAAKEGFTRIVFDNTAKNRVATLQEFFQGIGVASPEILAVSPQNAFTLFVHTGKTRNRLGFAMDVPSPTETQTIVQTIEPGLEKNFATVAALAGPKDTSYSASFRTIPNQPYPIRCQAFSSQDVGICYSILNNTLVFTTSFESMKATLNQITTWQQLTK